MKKTLSASHRYFSDLKIHFWCHLCRVLPVLKVNINFSLQKQLDKNSDPTDSTQPNFFRHKMLLKRPQIGITTWSFQQKRYMATHWKRLSKETLAVTILKSHQVNHVNYYMQFLSESLNTAVGSSKKRQIVHDQMVNQVHQNNSLNGISSTLALHGYMHWNYSTGS